MPRARSGAVVAQVGTLFGEGSVAGLSDGHLLARFAEGQGATAELAFAALVARHGPMVRGVCRRILRDEHEAEDAFQAVFLVLARRAGSIRQPALLAAWLHGVAARVAREARRKVRPTPQGGQAEAATEERPEWSAARREEAEALHEEVERLPEGQRVAVVLCHFEGLTQQEAAQHLGTPIGTIGVRLMRARERLRDCLTRRGLAPALAVLGASSITPQSVRAAVSPILGTTTAKAALAFTQERAVVAGEVSAESASLAEGVLRAMTLSKLKIAAVGLLVLGLAASGGWAFVAPRAKTKGPRPAPPRAQAKAEADDSEEAKALAEFNKVYRLDPGQFVKRIPPPFAPWRLVDVERRFPHLKEDRQQRGWISTLIYHERSGKLNNVSMVLSGNPQDEGRWIMYLLKEVGFSLPDIVGPDDLLKTGVQGDFIFRAGSPDDKLVPAFEAILHDECHLPIKLTVREVGRDVIVARGRYTPKLLADSKDTIELYGATLTPGVGGGASGSFAELLQWTGEFIEPHTRIIDEVEKRPDGQISWHLNYRDRMTEETTREDRGADAVLAHLTEQTGLTFTPEHRKVRVLFVERAD